MLVISRRKGQRITIGDEIELVVTELHRSSVKLGISAPRGYSVLRGEVHDSIESANRDALENLDGLLDLDPQLTNAGDVPAAAPAPLAARQLSGGDARQKQNGPDIIRRRPARDATADDTPTGGREAG